MTPQKAMDFILCPPSPDNKAPFVANKIVNTYLIPNNKKSASINVSVTVIDSDLQTRPPGTEVESADLAQSALERTQKVFADIGTKRLVALAQHGVARAQTLFAQAQVTFGEAGVGVPCFRKNRFGVNSA